MIFKIQRNFNNSLINIKRIFNEAFYEFTSIQSFDVISSQFSFVVETKTNFRFVQRIARFEIIDFIIFDQMQFKLHYNDNYKSLFMKIDE